MRIRPSTSRSFLRPLPPEEHAALLYLEAFYQVSPYDMVGISVPNVSGGNEEAIRHFRSLSKQKTRLLEEAWERPEVGRPRSRRRLPISMLASRSLRPPNSGQCHVSATRPFTAARNQAARDVCRVVARRRRAICSAATWSGRFTDLKMLTGCDLRVRGGLATTLALHRRALSRAGAAILETSPGINTRQCSECCSPSWPNTKRIRSTRSWS